MSDTKTVDTETHGSAPYVAFQSIKTMVADMKQHGVPGRIDRGVLSNFSGSVAKQIMTALKFLELTDADNHPQPALKELVNAYDTDDWHKALSEVLMKPYRPLFALDLSSASSSQFNERFRISYPGADAVQRKQATFFLNAAREAQFVISPYIMKNKKPRTGPTKKREARQNGGVGAVSNSAATLNRRDPPPPAPPAGTHRLSEQVLGVLDQEDLPKDVETAVFTLLRHLRKEGR